MMGMGPGGGMPGMGRAKRSGGGGGAGTHGFPRTPAMGGHAMNPMVAGAMGPMMAGPGMGMMPMGGMPMGPMGMGQMPMMGSPRGNRNGGYGNFGGNFGGSFPTQNHTPRSSSLTDEDRLMLQTTMNLATHTYYKEYEKEELAEKARQEELARQYKQEEIADRKREREENREDQKKAAEQLQIMQQKSNEQNMELLRNLTAAITPGAMPPQKRPRPGNAPPGFPGFTPPPPIRHLDFGSPEGGGSPPGSTPRQVAMGWDGYEDDESGVQASNWAEEMAAIQQRTAASRQHPSRPVDVAAWASWKAKRTEINQVVEKLRIDMDGDARELLVNSTLNKLAEKLAKLQTRPQLDEVYISIYPGHMNSPQRWDKQNLVAHIATKVMSEER